MARIPTISRLVTEDFTDQKSWIGKLLQPLNTFMSTVVASLDRGLTFEENIQCRIKEVKFRYSTELPLYFQNELPRRPKGVLVLQAISLDSSGSDATPVTSNVSWQVTADNRVKVTDFTGMSSGTYYRVNLLVI